jgi:hypothetical protein
VASTGEKKITGSVAGFVTRIEKTALPRFVCTLCGSCQLDLMMQQFYSKNLDELCYVVQPMDIHRTGKCCVNKVW